MHQSESCSAGECCRPGLPQSFSSGNDEDEIRRKDERKKWELTAHHGGEFCLVEAGDAGQCDDGNPQGAESDGRGVGNERDRDCLPGAEAEPQEQVRCHGHRRPETSGPFKQGPKTERYQDRLNPHVAGGMLGHPASQELEVARVNREVVEPERGEDDPHDGPEAIHATVGCA